MKTERLQRIQRVMRVQKVVEALENQEAEAVLPSPPVSQPPVPCAAAALAVCVALADAVAVLPAQHVPASAVPEAPSPASPPKDRGRRAQEAYDIQRGGVEKIAEEKAKPARRPAPPTLRQLKAAKYWYVPIFDLPG